MKHLHVRISSAILIAVLLGTARPASAALTVGDPAPKLDTGAWVQGEPVKDFNSNHVYIVEFWATWCGPCRASIPHLNELYEKFKDQGLIAIGQDIWENDEDAVAPFVKKMGDQMTYRVALDNKTGDSKGVMAKTWMEAAGQNGIPTAFVINRQGRIAWIGHPMGLREQVLGEIMAGTFDTAAFARQYEKDQQADRERAALNAKLRSAMNDKNWKAAEAALSELEQTLPESARLSLGTVRLQILFGQKDYDAACKLAETLSDERPDGAGLQNDIAWTMAKVEGLDEHGLALAEKIAKRGNAAAEGQSPAILDTLARVQFRLGNHDEAIANQKKAVDLAAGRMKTLLEQTLASYQEGKLPPTGE